MKEQNKSPLNFNFLGVGRAATRGAIPSFDGKGGLAGLKRHIQAFNNNTAEAMPQDPSSGGIIPAGDQAVGAQAPAPTAIGPASGGNPFEGKTFTISPAQMRNVKNVFGDTDERQTSVGQNTGQGSENYDTYEEESPLTKKSCGSYKK